MLRLSTSLISLILTTFSKQALIPQCIHGITLNEVVPRSKSLEIAALRALLSVIQACQPRMYHWKGTIIEGVGKYWVMTCESEKTEGEKLVCVFYWFEDAEYS